MIEFTDFSFYNKTWFRILRVSELSHYCSQNLYLTKKYSKDKPWVFELNTGFF